MARQIVETITDDLDGSKDASPVSFAYEGTEYTIDLSKKNKSAFDKVMKPYLDAATKQSRRPSGTSRRSSSAPKRNDLSAVREWAKAAGHTVSDRGRVSAEIQSAYDAAH